MDCRICKKMRVSEGISGAVHLHKYMLDIEKVTVISDEMRAVVESEWPELESPEKEVPRRRQVRSWRVSLIRKRALRKVVVPSSVDTAAIPRK